MFSKVSKIGVNKLDHYSNMGVSKYWLISTIAQIMGILTVLHDCIHFVN